MQKFSAYDAEELGELVSRRSELSDEAVEALDGILSARGLKESDVFAAPQPLPPCTQEEEQKQVESQTTSSRELWYGGLSIICKFLVAITFIAPGQNFLKSVPLGALWAALLVGAPGCAGYYVGHVITRSICANPDIPIQAKKKNLWIMFVVLWPVYLAVNVASNAAFVRG